MHKTFTLGRLAKDPRMHAGKKTLVAKFILVVNDRIRGKDSPPVFYKMTAFGPVAEVIQKHCKKGSRVHIESRMQNVQWDDKDGVTQYRTEFVIDQLTLCD